MKGFAEYLSDEYPKTRQAVQNAFRTLPQETRHKLCFAAENGEYCQRVRLWQTLLKPICHSANITKPFTLFYSHFEKVRNGG